MRKPHRVNSKATTPARMTDSDGPAAFPVVAATFGFGFACPHCSTVNHEPLGEPRLDADGALCLAPLNVTCVGCQDTFLPAIEPFGQLRAEANE